MSAPADFDLESFLPYRLNKAAEAASHAFQEVYRDRYGMTRTEWRVLAHLGQYGELTARDICERAALHKTKVSRAVFALEKRRWLARRADEKDRRVEHLALTDKGRELFRNLGQAARALDAEFRARLGDEAHARLLKLLDDISAPDISPNRP